MCIELGLIMRVYPTDKQTNILILLILDEIHFLIDCNRYKYERCQMYDKIEDIFPNFRSIPGSKSKFIFLMSQENIIITKILAFHIHRSFHIGGMK